MYKDYEAGLLSATDSLKRDFYRPKVTNHLF